MKLVYDVHERPPFAKNLLYAFQQLLAVIAATVLVPTLVNGLSGTQLLNHGAAMIGAGLGTIVYLLFTNLRAPYSLARPLRLSTRSSVLPRLATGALCSVR